MGSVRFSSLLLLAAFLAACSDHPITIGRAYVAQPAPVRSLVETPPPAVVPIPPTPELKPGTEVSADTRSSGPSLERLRAEGDVDAEFLASNGTETPVLQSAETNSMSAPAAEAGAPDSGSTAADTATSAGNTGAASADADPQRQAQDGHCRESWAVDERAGRVPQVLQQRMHQAIRRQGRP